MPVGPECGQITSLNWNNTFKEIIFSNHASFVLVLKVIIIFIIYNICVIQLILTYLQCRIFLSQSMFYLFIYLQFHFFESNRIFRHLCRWLKLYEKSYCFNIRVRLNNYLEVDRKIR